MMPPRTEGTGRPEVRSRHMSRYDHVRPLHPLVLPAAIALGIAVALALPQDLLMPLAVLLALTIAFAPTRLRGQPRPVPVRACADSRRMWR